MLRLTLAVPTGSSESETETVKVEDPPEVGVPEMVPLELRERPAGRPPLVLQVYGCTPPLAFTVAL